MNGITSTDPEYLYDPIDSGQIATIWARREKVGICTIGSKSHTHVNFFEIGA